MVAPYPIHRMNSRSWQLISSRSLFHSKRMVGAGSSVAPYSIPSEQSELVATLRQTLTPFVPHGRVINNRNIQLSKVYSNTVGLHNQCIPPWLTANQRSVTPIFPKRTSYHKALLSSQLLSCLTQEISNAFVPITRQSLSSYKPIREDRLHSCLIRKSGIQQPTQHLTRREF